MERRRNQLIAWWWGAASGPLAGCARLLLAPAAVVFGLLARIRRATYAAGSWRREVLPVPVVSIGNLTVGGTGKTPTVRWVCEILQGAGLRPVVVARGFGTRPAGAELDEEGLALRAVLPNVTIEQSPRPRELLTAARWDSAPAGTVIVLDDGFQKVWLARDLEVVLLDATRPFGAGWCLPAGPLREPRGALRAAQVIILSRCDQAGSAAVDLLRRQVQALAPAALLLRQRHAPDRLVFSGRDPASLRGRRVMLLSAIGNSAAFEATVQGLGATIVGHHADGDHAPLGEAEVRSAREAAVRQGADLVLATGKDAPKLAAFTAGVPPLDALEIRVEFVDDPAPLESRLRALRDWKKDHGQAPHAPS